MDNAFFFSSLFVLRYQDLFQNLGLTIFSDPFVCLFAKFGFRDEGLILVLPIVK